MKNYVKIFEEENRSLIKKTRIRVRITFVLLLGVFPLVCVFLLPDIIENEIYSDKLILWCFGLMVGLLFTYFIERRIKRLLKIKAALFASNIVVDSINLLRTKFYFEINNEFVLNDAHGYEYSFSENNWLNSCSFTSYYNIYFQKVGFTVNDLKYKLIRVEYQNNKPFRFHFDITHSDGRIERNVEYEF